MVKSIDKKIGELNKKINSMKKTMKAWENDAEKKIKKNPVESVAAAFGIGALAGAVIVALMRRKK